ncbi:MAG: RnfABCDGE type electron transport complex subunit D [Treponema sp.]|jgi:electron transport complex protein RnfD|nr:RnfABCDGE type electron transport complex subunit D [Treponema sp.]
MNQNLIVSYAPHIRDKASVNRIMLDVIIALCPSFIVAIWIFGPKAALVTGVCVVSCVFFEWAFEKLTKRKNTISDFSAALTGILLAYNLPVTIPLWQAVVGSFTAIVLVKQLFGGLGKNFANPAVTGRIVMFLAFPITMTTWVAPFDTVTGATPLVELLRMFRNEIYAMPGTWDLFLGVHGGCIGETSELALLIGFAYLLIRRVIAPIVPFAFIGTVFVLTFLAGGADFAVYHILTGGLFLGAVFCATDYVTSPITNRGRLIFGVGCGIITVVIRLYGSYPEGVSFAILLMNMLVPYINKISFKKALGGKYK